MPGLGTLVNVIAIVIGGILGLLFGNLLNKRIQETLIAATGVGTIFLGVAGAMEKMLKIENGSLSTTLSMMMILSLVIGGLIGEVINIEHYFETFGNYLKEKSGNAKDPTFTQGFVDASLVVCIGAMAIVGAINDGIYHQPDTLFAKAVLDFIIIMVMASAEGKGVVFSAISVGVLQGSITILARLIKPIMTTAALTNISLVGSVLIACVGINLLFGKKVRVANFLPALIIAIIFAFFPIG